MFDPIIRLDGVSKRFGAVDAVKDVDLTVDRGEFVALLGPSGCGKTTLLRLIAGFEQPDAGEIFVHGDRVTGHGVWVPPERRRVGMVFQDYALFPHLTVGDNVSFGLPRRERRARVAEALALVGLGAYQSRYPHQLSGGQQQRVALARALAPRPALVLLDEPWSNIDPHLRASMREQLSGILRGVGVTVILVTHDREEAFSLADRIALMRGGELVQEGSAEDLYFAPVSRWAAEFAGEGNFVPGEIFDGHVQTELGTFPATNTNGSKNVQALIRPELLELRPDPAGVAEVVSREFRGHDVFYRVQLNGYELVALRPSTEVVPLGSKVAIQPHRVPVAVFD